MSGDPDPTRDPETPSTVMRGRGTGRRGGGESQAGRPVVVVLGMHRSGTSLLSNLLHYLGVDMADTTDHVSERNAGGFWERPELNRLQDEVLEAIGRPIAAPEHCLPFPAAWWRRKEVQAIKPRLVAFVAGELAKSSNLWGFKDPRTCRLLPLWWEVFRDLELTPIYVHALRSPAESALSMSIKNPARAISPTRGELMWIAYNYDILRYVAPDHPPLTIVYEDWFADGAQVARRLVDALGIGQRLTGDELRECVETMVAPERRHHVAGMGNAVSRVPTADLLYDAVRAGQRESGAGSRALAAEMSFIGRLMKSAAPIVSGFAATGHRDVAAAEALDERIAILSRELHSTWDEVEAPRAKESDARWSRRADDDPVALSSTEAVGLRSDDERGRHDDRLSVERIRTRRLAAALAARDERIASLEARLAAQPAPGAASGALLAWPGGRSNATLVEDYGLAGAIDRVDRVGIAGWVRFYERPELVPIVEMVVDGAFVLAQACVASGDRHAFAIAWRDAASEYAGRPALVRVAGIGQTIAGPDLIVPPAQRHLHQVPAHLAAELFGGSVPKAEAYHARIAAHDEDGALAAARARLADGDTAWPVISVIVHGDDVDGRMSASVAALKAQVYPYWEALCPGAPVTLEALDPRVRVVPAGSSPGAAASGDLASFVEAGDLIAPTALLHLAAAALDAAPGFSLIYSDEDRIDPLSGVRGAPIMKSGRSADPASAQEDAGRLALIHRDRLPDDTGPLDAARIRQIVAAAAGDAPLDVIHLPLVLYHRTIGAARAPGADRARATAAPGGAAAAWAEVGGGGGAIRLGGLSLGARAGTPDPRIQAALDGFARLHGWAIADHRGGVATDIAVLGFPFTGEALRVADIAFQSDYDLRMRIDPPQDGVFAEPMRVRVHQADGDALILCGEDLVAGDGPLFVAARTRNPFLPLLITLVTAGGTLHAATLLPFPSLLAGGVHRGEVSARPWIGSRLEDAKALSEALLRAHLTGGDAPSIAAIAIDPTGATGAERIFSAPVREWLALVARVRVTITGDDVPGFLAERLPDAEHAAAAEDRAGRGLALLTLPCDALPTVAALFGRGALGPDGHVIGTFVAADPIDAAPYACVFQPAAAGAGLGPLQPVGAPPPFPWLKTIRDPGLGAAPGGTPVAIRYHSERTSDAGLLLRRAPDTTGPLLAAAAAPVRAIEAIVAVCGSTGRVPGLLQSLANQRYADVLRVAIVVGRDAQVDAGPIEAAARRLFADRHRIVFTGTGDIAADLDAAASASDAEYLLFADGSVVLHDPRTLETLVTLAQAPGVASAGCLMVRDGRDERRTIVVHSGGLFPDNEGGLSEQDVFSVLPRATYASAGNGFRLALVGGGAWRAHGRGGGADRAAGFAARTLTAGLRHLTTSAVSASLLGEALPIVATVPGGDAPAWRSALAGAPSIRTIRA